MAKKKNKPQQSSTTSSDSSPASDSSSASSSPASSPALTGEAGTLERAFVLGNFAQVRQLAKSVTTEPGRATAARLLEKITVEREQVIVGIAGLIVVAIAAMLTLR